MSDVALWEWKTLDTKNARVDQKTALLNDLPRIVYDTLLGRDATPALLYRVTHPDDARLIMTLCGWQHRPATPAPKSLYDMLHDAGKLVLPLRPSETFTSYMESMPADAPMEECYKNPSFVLDFDYYASSEDDPLHESTQALLDEALEWKVFDTTKAAWLHQVHKYEEPDLRRPTGVPALYHERTNTMCGWMPEYVRAEFEFVNRAYLHLGTWIEFARFAKTVASNDGRARIEVVLEGVLRKRNQNQTE